MSSDLSKLIPTLVAYVNARGGYVTKTRLLKLLYLIDLEYYRSHNATVTDFTWRYLHLGPWAAEFDPILEDLRKTNALQERQSTHSDFETKYFQSESSPNLRPLFSSYAEESIAKNVLDLWGDRTTAEILDHVYFHTEPMEFGIRSERLDFSKVAPNPPPIYKRTPSGKTSAEIAAMRKAFEAKKTHAVQPQFEFRAPQYDEEFRTGMAKLESGDV
jgi:hypothetical protein